MNPIAHIPIADRADLAKSMLDVLLAAMQADCRPSMKAVEDVILATSIIISDATI